MAWSADTGTQVQNLVTQIATRLTASGWTLTDRTADGVWNSTNDQGVTQYIQITNVGAYQYIQFQAFTAWDTGAHTGTNGSGTTYQRLYYAPAAVGATTPVDLYMSVSSNRFFIFIQGVAWRNWAYFGGLDSAAGSSDPTCALLSTSYQAETNTIAATNGAGLIQGGPYYTTVWTGVAFAFPCLSYRASTADVAATDPNAAMLRAQGITANAGQSMVFPITVVDGGFINSSVNVQLSLRGNLDGIYYCPMGWLGHLDTISIGGVTYLVIVPGGGPGTANTHHPVTGNYSQALAIKEV